MNHGPTCGVWPGSRGRIAAVADDAGCIVFEGTLPQQQEHWAGWIATLEARHGPGLALVLTERTARYDRVGRVAIELGRPVWIAPSALIAQISRAAWFRPAPRQLAALLARLPSVRAYRPALRVAPAVRNPRQLKLFRAG